MTVQIALALGVLVGISVLARGDRLSPDLAAFLGMVALLALGQIPPAEAFAGLSSPAVVAVLSLSLVSAALLRTGVVAAAGRDLRHLLRGRSEPALVAAVVVAGGALGALLGPLLATAALMPAVASIARDARLSQSRVLLPLSAGAIVGGAATGFGAPGTIVAAAVGLPGGPPPGPFAFSAAGFAALLAAALALAFARRALLPSHGSATGADAAEDLARVYRLHEHVFSIRVSPGSALIGRTLGETGLGALDVQVLTVRHADGERASAEPDTEIREGDILLLRGRIEDLRRLMQVRGVDVRETRAADLPRPAAGVTAARARLVAGSTVVGRSLRELNFRERFGVMVVGIERDGRILREHLADARLENDDEILILGRREDLDRFDQFPQWKIVDLGLGAIQRLQDHLFLMRVHEGSALAGVTLEESRVGELVGLTVGGVIRDGVTRLAPERGERIEVGDRLLVSGEPWRIVKLLEYGEVVSDVAETSGRALEAEDVQVAEIAVAPRSGASGRTLAELAFRHRYGLQVLGVWRGGRPIEDTLSRIVLRLGDALLVQGPRERVEALANDPDFVVLDATAKPVRRRKRAALSLVALVGLVAAVASGWQPLHVAAFAAAVVVVAGGAVRMEEAYRAVDWRTVFVIVAFVPISAAVERSGATAVLAERIADLARDVGPHSALAAFGLVGAALAQALGGAPAMLLLLPAAALVGTSAGIDPSPFVVGGALVASAAMFVPRRFRGNLVVAGAGGYRFLDFLRVGLAVDACVLAAAVWIVPLGFPF